MPSLRRLLCHNLIFTAILFQAFSTVYGQSPDAKTKGTGSISGRVTIDGKGAPGIVVAALGGDMPTRGAAAKTTTDSEGRYRLFGLSAAQYQVTALAPSFALTSFSNSSYYQQGQTVVLSPAESVEDIDLKLVRGGVITGRVTDSDGKAVVEERVALQLVDQTGAPARQQVQNFNNYQMYETDDRGVYRIYGLPAGRYKVSLGNDPGKGNTTTDRPGYYALTFYPDVNDPAKATIVELSEGSEAANIDIKVGRRANTFSATGRVVDGDTGQPASGIRFMYGPVQRDQELTGGSIDGPINSRGEFRIEGLEPGRYGVSLVPGFEAGNFYSDPVFFEVVDSDVSNLEIKATRGLSLSGVVVPDGEANKEVLAQLVGLRITATVSSASRQAQNYSSSSIQADGTFQINGLRPGKAALFIYAGPNPRLRLRIARIERDGLDQKEGIEISPGQSVSGLRVFVVFGTRAIRGTVKFEGGTPPPNAQIFVQVRPEGSMSISSGAPVDSRGHFLISNLAAGTYEVTLYLSFVPSTPPQQPSPLKRIVTVANDTEAELNFVVDLTPKSSGP